MNTHDIDKILYRNSYTKQFYIGCFSSDKIPLPSKFPCCFCVNTDVSYGKGEHWVAIYHNTPYCVEYFDSLGVWPPSSPQISDYLGRFLEKQINRIQFQSSFSSTCGLFICYFLTRRCSQRYTFFAIIRELCVQNKHADKFILQYAKKHIFNIEN
jgi:hypothetical protein